MSNTAKPTGANLAMRAAGAALFLLTGALPTAASCSPAGEPATAIPNDGKDDLASLQTQIDRMSAAGGGTLLLAPGTYDLSMPLYLRSGVHVRGQGKTSILSNRRLNQRDAWFGTTVFTGNFTPATYSYHEGRGYAGRPSRRRSDHEIEIEGCEPQALARLPGNVVWLSTPDHITGIAGVLKPVQGEINLVRQVTGCRVTLDAPIGIPAGEDLLFYWSDGTRSLPGGHMPNQAISNAGLHNLTIESARAQAMVGSGCYRCSFTGLHIANTRRLLGIEGMRFNEFRDISGDFNEKGIEFAMYATDNVIEGVRGEYRNNNNRQTRPVIRFGEYPRRNVVRNVELRLGAGYARRDKIRFDASEDNRLENVRIFTDGDDRWRSMVYVPPKERSRGMAGRLPPGTAVENVQLCFDERGTECVSVE